MTNQFQESLLVTGRGHDFRLALVQAAVGIGLACVISIFGMVIASQAHGQEAPKHVSTANVLPELRLWPESQQPNLNGVLATGDGAASLPLEEIVGGVSRDAFDRQTAHAKTGTSPR